MNTEATIDLKSSLDDLVALLLQGQAPFGDKEFIDAARTYRAMIRGGAMARQQVNLAACLYLTVKEERPTAARVMDLGGWGSRNDVLADITAFGRGTRPATSSGLSKAAMSLAAPSTSILQIAMSQGLDAAHKALEKELRQNFDAQVEEIQRLADQRVQAAERNAMGATELKEAAQAESKLLESKFDQAVTGRTELTNKAAAAEARSQELVTQVAALTGALAQANERLATAEQGARALQAQLDEINARREAERRESMLAMDKARHGQDQLLATQQAEISRLGGLLEKAQEAGEGHAQAARRAEAMVASSQAELSAATAKIGDLQGQVEVLNTRLDEAVSWAGAGETIVETLKGVRSELNTVGQVLVELSRDAAKGEDVIKVAGEFAAISFAVKSIAAKLENAK